MKKKIIKLLSLVLSLFFVASSVACNDDPEEDDGGYKIPTYNGTHIMNATETSEYLVEDGRTKYIIVKPANANENEGVAVQEFQNLFKDATDVNIRVETDTGKTYDEDAYYISIGETTLLQEAKQGDIEIDYSKLLKDGCGIKTVGNMIFIYGGSYRGVIYGVYAFMEILFDYETYSFDVYNINKFNSNVKMRDFDVLDIPDFTERPGENYETKTSSSDYNINMFRYRSRAGNERYDNFVTPRTISSAGDTSYTTGVAKSTNTHDIMDITRYPTHAKWFAENIDQWCYTAHGDADEYQAMVEEVARICIASFKQNASPDKCTTLTITQEDNGVACNCASCQALKEKYGTDAGAYCIFFNDVGKIVDEWMQDQADENAEFHSKYLLDYHIIFFAYAYNRTPPTVFNSKGEQVPVDEKVVLRDNIGIYEANSICGYGVETKSNSMILAEGWNSLTDFALFWDYKANFLNLLYPYHSDGANSDYFNYMASSVSNAFLFDQKIAPENGGTNWIELKAYIDDTLRWNCSKDYNEIIKNYFKNVYYFDELADAMFKIYLSVNTYYKDISAGKRIDVDESAAFGSAEYPVGVIKSWISMFDKALELCDTFDNANNIVDGKYSKDDYEAGKITRARFNQIRNSVLREQVQPLWMLNRLYSSSLNKSDLLELYDKVIYALGVYGSGQLETESDKTTVLNAYVVNRAELAAVLN